MTGVTDCNVEIRGLQSLIELESNSVTNSVNEVGAIPTFQTTQPT